LQIIPGTHTHMNYDETKNMHYDPERINSEVKDGTPRGFFGYDYRELQFDPNWKPNEQDAHSLVMERGQCVIFWSTLMHASLPNTSRGRDYRMGFASRYVPNSVQIYPGTDHIEEYGGAISLERWGAVQARGSDTFGHNKIATETLRGTPYRTVTDS
jgi:non-heme Fe2+,alpha-ketoglutarate-dependent halogenase